jgi:hypothetical protein
LRDICVQTTTIGRGTKGSFYLHIDTGCSACKIEMRFKLRILGGERLRIIVSKPNSHNPEITLYKLINKFIFR